MKGTTDPLAPLHVLSSQVILLSRSPWRTARPFRFGLRRGKAITIFYVVRFKQPILKTLIFVYRLFMITGTKNKLYF
jgi:hypothetical protein